MNWKLCLLRSAVFCTALAALPNLSHAQIETGLLNYWDFEGSYEDKAGEVNGSSSTVDDDGTNPAGNVTITTGGPLGSYGDFGRDYVEVADSVDVVAAGESLSISAWFRVDGFDQNWQAIIAHGEGTDYRIARRAAENTLGYAGGVGDIPAANIGPDINDGEWHHVVSITEAGVSTRLWMDGVLIATGGVANITDNGGGRLMLGGNPQGNAADAPPTQYRAWNGGIDDVAMWDRVLTDAEIGELHTEGTAGKSLADLISPATGEDDDGGVGDGMDDGWEIAVGLDPDVDDSAGNPDNDGLTNLEEWNDGDNPTDPFNSDSDDDDLIDGDEINTHSTDPNDPDSDDDGLSDGDEIAAATLPLNPDTDGDDFNDGYEVTNVAFGFDPLVDDSAEDADTDGLSNEDELTEGTDPIVADSDGDGTNDGDEVNGLVNPYDAAGDFVGLPGESTDPLDDDSDDDSVLDGAETSAANGSVTNPNDADTDGDGFDDALEIASTTDPTDELDFPNIGVPAATMSWIASQDLDGDNLWPTVEAPEIAGIAWDFGAPTSPVFGLANLVSAWYSAPSAGMQSFNDAPLSAAPFGQATNQPASFELVFRPGDLDENHLLFETGGNGDGTAFVLNGSLLEFRAQDANNAAQRIILNHTFTAGDEAMFHHLVATVQTGPTGTNRGVLYVNGVEVDTFDATGTINDWAGGDDSGLGRVTGGTSTGQTGFAPFTGDIAILRFYAGSVLIAPEVQALFDELSASAVDSDDDELPDGWETFFIGDLSEDGTGNSDDDGLTNAEELLLGTDPTEADTDADDIDDGDEVAGTSNPYTNGMLGAAPGDPTSPINPDSDNDGANDGVEISAANGSVSDPNNPDTDGDNFRDGIEIDNDADPTDPSSVPDVPAVVVLGAGTTSSGDFLLGGDLTDPEDDIDDNVVANPNGGDFFNWLNITSTSKAFFSPGGNGGAADEGAFDIFDNKVGPDKDKWCCDGAPQSVTVEFEEPVSITHFTVTSSNDTPDRDPRDWEIQGSDDGVVFESIFTQAGDPQLWTARNQTIQITLPSPSDAYRYIRYDVTRTGNANHALNEIEFFGTVGPQTPLAISEISYNPTTDEISVTWNSKPGKDYGLFYSLDMVNWDSDVDDSIASQGETTTYDFVNPEPDSPVLFLRVMEN